MKKRFTEIMNELEPGELDKLLEGIDEKGDSAASKRISERVISGMGVSEQKREDIHPRRVSRRTVWAIAACLVFAVVLCVGTYAYADAAEYSKAKAFFEEHHISVEGLTRSEIKAVYRDITSESYTYSKTGEVLAHSIDTNSISGWTIRSGEVPPYNFMEALNENGERYNNEIHFSVEYEDETVVIDGKQMLKHKYGSLTENFGNKKIWTYTSSVMRFYYAEVVSDGVIGIGVISSDYEVDSDRGRSFKPAITKLGFNGEFIWFVTWDNSGGKEEDVSGVVECADGTLAVLSEVRDYDENRFALCVTKIDREGNYLGSKVNPTNDVWVCDPIPYSEGYLAIQYSNTGDHRQSVVRITADGRLAGEYSFAESGRNYTIAGAAAFGGKIFISAQYTDRSKTAELFSDEYLKEIEEEYSGIVPAEVFTPTAKEIFRSVLLVCDPYEVKPEVFFEVEGSIAGGLDVTEGRLVWKVEPIASCDFTPSLNSRSFSGTTEKWEYVFDVNGVLTENRNTGEHGILLR